MAKGGSDSKKNGFALGFWKGRNRNYDDVSLSGEPLLQSGEESSSSASEGIPQLQKYGATLGTAIALPKSNTTCTTASSTEGLPEPPSSSSRKPASSIALYDLHSILELSSSLCQGYVTLLSAGKTSEQAKGGGGSDDDNHIALAYASVTDGNVIDVCFGIVNFSSASKASELTKQQIKDAKDIIDALIDSDLHHDADNDGAISLEEVVVRAYRRAFESIIKMNDRVKRLNFIAKCFCHRRIRRQTAESLRENFHQLQQNIVRLQARQQ